MAYYSIKDLEKLSGIKAHTIRIWEKRYNLIEPSRTITNIRYYDDEDLKKILNISILNQNGFRISRIAELDDAQLRDRVVDMCLDVRNTNVQIESLLVSMLELDEQKFSKVLANSIIKSGFECTVESILFPFLERIGLLWQAGTINPAQEHFISNLVRQKIIVAIDNEMQNTPVQHRERILFFLPEHEYHEIGLLFFSLIARKEGFEVLYLGTSVPLADLRQVMEIRAAHMLFFSLVSNRNPEDMDRLLREISREALAIPVVINGYQIKDYKRHLPANFNICGKALEFKQLLNLHFEPRA